MAIAVVVIVVVAVVVVVAIVVPIVVVVVIIVVAVVVVVVITFVAVVVVLLSSKWLSSQLSLSHLFVQTCWCNIENSFQAQPQDSAYLKTALNGLSPLRPP